MAAPPDNPTAEATAAVVRGAVSAIPLLGGVLAEVGDLYLNPLAKRQERWAAEVTAAINEIGQRFEVLPAQLKDDEQFVSFLFQATMIAFKNHQQSKLDALRAAVVGAGDPESPPDDLQFQFLRYVDELSVTHVTILKCLDRHAGQFGRLTKLESVYAKLADFVGLNLGRDAFRAFVQDLQSRFLFQLGDVEELPEFASRKSYLMTEDSKKRRLGVTAHGRSFLKFLGQ